MAKTKTFPRIACRRRGALAIGIVRADRSLRPEHRRRRQELHRATDSRLDDVAISAFKGLHRRRNAPGLGSAALRQAQESGQIDVYWEYTGTSLITYNGVKDKLDAAATYTKVKELDAAKGLTWLKASAANNTYAIAMRAR